MIKSQTGQTAKPRTVLIAALRNEGPFLIEWIAYHRVIGFDEIILFSDTSMDGSNALLDALDGAGVATHIANPGPGGHRNRAYQIAQTLPQVQAADWVMALDTDEFLNIHVGKGMLSNLLAAGGNADVISPAWRLFGHSGIIAFEDAPILPRFVQAAPLDITLTDRQFGLKSLFRPKSVAKIGPHRPALVPNRLSGKIPTCWINGSGDDVTSTFLKKGWAASPKTVGYGLAQINHYMVRSAEVFALHNLQSPPMGSEPTPLTLADFAAFNTNHETDQSISRHANAIAAEEERIRGLKGVAEAHEQAVASTSALVRTMRKVYDLDPRSDVAQALNAHAAKSLLKEQQAWLSDKRKPAKEPRKDPRTTVIETVDLAPRWLADLRRSKHRKGWYHSDEKFAAQFTHRSKDTLVVSFDNLSNVKDASLARETWGYGFYSDEGWSHFGVMAFEKNWFRDEALFDFMERQESLFSQYKQVVMTGTSMGAYAATAFANLAPGCTVLAFSPQSTLAKALVPWEKRFNSGRKQDWSGRYRDAAECCDRAKHVFVIYDPYFAPDRTHADRYSGKNTVHLKSWYSSHKSAQFMRRADILKAVMQDAVAGKLTAQSYYRRFRSRRDLIWYYNGLADHLIDKGHTRLANQLASHLVTIKKPGIARAIREKL